MIHSIKFWLFVFALLCFGGSYVPAQGTLVFVAMEDFPPYSYLENGKPTGIDVKIINEMAHRGGLKIKIDLLPWKRVMHYTKYGTVDGAFAAFKTPERENLAYYVGPPFHKSVYKIYVKKEKTFQFNCIQDLYGKRIGQNPGFFINNKFERAVWDNNIIALEASMKLNFKRLVHDRIDGVVGNMDEVWPIVQELNLSDRIVALPKSVKKPRGAYLMIPKKSKTANKENFIQNVSNILTTMEADGTIDRINAIYLQKNGNRPF